MCAQCCVPRNSTRGARRAARGGRARACGLHCDLLDNARCSSYPHMQSLFCLAPKAACQTGYRDVFCERKAVARRARKDSNSSTPPHHPIKTAAGAHLLQLYRHDPTAHCLAHNPYHRSVAERWSSSARRGAREAARGGHHHALFFVPSGLRKLRARVCQGVATTSCPQQSDSRARYMDRSGCHYRSRAGRYREQRGEARRDPGGDAQRKAQHSACASPPRGGGGTHALAVCVV